MTRPDASANVPPSPVMMGRGERLAMDEIALTEVQPAHGVVFIGLFFAFLIGVFLWDIPTLRSIPNVGGQAEPAAAAPLSTASSVTTALPGWTQAVFKENRKVLDWIKSTESHLDDHSSFAKALRPRMQEFLASCGEGGKEVMAGKDGWLFYRPSFRFLTRPPQDSSAGGPRAVREDAAAGAGYLASVTAATQFAAALRQRGISLVMLPVWPKMSVQPENLGGPAYRRTEVLKPREFAAWKTALEQAGVAVFDPGPTLMAAKAAHGGAAYLKTDSHWNPAAMQACAAGLARFLTDRGLAQAGTAKTTLVGRTVTNQGDLARMLQLPLTARQFPPEPAQISEVRGDRGTRWLTARAAPVLLLGDSFSNIFSLASMGWGQDAGLAEHLGAALGTPVDALLRNGDGASATRGLLSRELATGHDRLAGKRVVVWEFAASQLSEGRWLSFPYQLGNPPPSDGRFVEIGDENSQQVSGTVVEMGAVPHPSSTVYKEYVDYLVLEDLKWVSGQPLTGSQVVVYGLVMKDHQWTAAANLRPGQRIQASLRSWTSAEEEFGRHQRCEPPDHLLLEPINWLADFSVID